MCSVDVCGVCMCSNVYSNFNLLLPYTCYNQAKSERSWMLKILVDGLRTEQEYLLYKRHGVFTSAMAFWESAISDPQAKVKLIPPPLPRCIHTHTHTDTICRYYL